MYNTRAYVGVPTTLFAHISNILCFKYIYIYIYLYISKLREINVFGIRF